MSEEDPQTQRLRAVGVEHASPSGAVGHVDRHAAEALAVAEPGSVQIAVRLNRDGHVQSFGVGDGALDQASFGGCPVTVEADAMGYESGHRGA